MTHLKPAVGSLFGFIAVLGGGVNALPTPTPTERGPLFAPINPVVPDPPNVVEDPNWLIATSGFCSNLNVVMNNERDVANDDVPGNIVEHFVADISFNYYPQTSVKFTDFPHHKANTIEGDQDEADALVSPAWDHRNIALLEPTSTCSADEQNEQSWGISVFKVEEHRPCTDGETAWEGHPCVHFSGYVSAETSNFVNANQARFVCQLFVDSAQQRCTFSGDNPGCFPKTMDCDGGCTHTLGGLISEALMPKDDGGRWDNDDYAQPHIAFCEALQVRRNDKDFNACVQAYYTLDICEDGGCPDPENWYTPFKHLGVKAWVTMANDKGIDHWGISNSDICKKKTDYLEQISVEQMAEQARSGNCGACRNCGAVCVMYANKLRLHLEETYLDAVVPLLRVSVMAVSHTKFTQQVALTSALEKTRDTVFNNRRLQPSPPKNVENPHLILMRAINKLIVNTLFSFTHSASASFNFIPGAKGARADQLAALIRLVEKVAIPATNIANKLPPNEGTGPWQPNPNGLMYETRAKLDFKYAQMKDYYRLVLDNQAMAIKNQTGYLISSAWARARVAGRNVDFDGALDLAFTKKIAADGLCTPTGGSADRNTILFDMVDRTIRYSAFQQLLPVAYSVCAEPQALCKQAAKVMGYGGMQHRSCSVVADGSYICSCVESPELFSDNTCKTDTDFGLCISDELTFDTAVLFNGEDSGASLGNMECSAMQGFTRQRMDELPWASQSYAAWVCMRDSANFLDNSEWDDADNPRSPSVLKKSVLAEINDLVQTFNPTPTVALCPGTGYGRCPTWADLRNKAWDQATYNLWNAASDPGFCAVPHGITCGPGKAPCKLRCTVQGQRDVLTPCPGQPFARCPTATDLEGLHWSLNGLHDAWDGGSCQSPIPCGRDIPCRMKCVDPRLPNLPLNVADVAAWAPPDLTLNDVVEKEMRGPTRRQSTTQAGWNLQINRFPNGNVMNTRFYAKWAFANLRDKCGSTSGPDVCHGYKLQCGSDADPCEKQRVYFDQRCGCVDLDPANCGAYGQDGQGAQDGQQCYLGPSDGVLTIKVVSGRDVKGRGDNCEGTGSRDCLDTDPYVIVSVNGKSDRTDIQEDTDRPVWNKVMSFGTQPIGATIKIELWDDDTNIWARNDPDFMGSAQFAVSPDNTGDLEKFVQSDEGEGKIKLHVTLDVAKAAQLPCGDGLKCQAMAKGYTSGPYKCCEPGEGHCGFVPDKLYRQPFDIVAESVKAPGGYVQALLQEGKFEYRLQQFDGNAVVYNVANGAPLGKNPGACGTNAVLKFQADGNWVIYRDGCGSWTPNGNINADKLIMQADGNLVAYRCSTKYPMWKGNEQGGCHALASTK